MMDLSDVAASAFQLSLATSKKQPLPAPVTGNHWRFSVKHVMQLSVSIALFVFIETTSMT